MALDQGKIKLFEKRLLNEKGRLEKELDQIADKDKHLADDYDARFPNYGKEEVGSTDEFQDAIEAFDTAIGIENELELRLLDVNKAIEAIRDDNYGLCKNCNEPIPLERLEANPAARRCIKCRTIKESKNQT
jgi:DnaK suppressor protein